MTTIHTIHLVLHRKKRNRQWKLVICSQISQVYAQQVILDQILLHCFH